MEFQELKVLVAIVETGGFKRAGQQLNLSQSAISQSVANLERKIGEKLLERTTPIGITPIGHELLNHARYILDRENEFMSDLKKIKMGHLQRLNLSVDELVNDFFCHSSIQELSRRLPESSVKIKRLPAREIITAVMSDASELGFGPFQKNMDGLNTIKLFTEETVLVTSSKNKYFRLHKKDPIGFLKKNILLTSYIDKPQQRPSRKKIRDYFKNSWEINNLSLQINLVSKGLGLTFLPRRVLSHDLQAKKLIPLSNIPFSSITKPYGVYYKSKTPLSSIAQTFIEIIQKEVF